MYQESMPRPYSAMMFFTMCRHIDNCPPYQPEFDLPPGANNRFPLLVRPGQVSVFKHLEVNVFPSVPYSLDINIRRDEAAALQQYFKLEVRYCESSNTAPSITTPETPSKTQVQLSTARRIQTTKRSRQKRTSQGQRRGGCCRRVKIRPRRPAMSAAPGAASVGMCLPTRPTRLARRLAMAPTPAFRAHWNLKGTRRAAVSCLEGGQPDLCHRTRRGWRWQQQWRDWSLERR